MALNISYQPHTLHFKFEAGTSRGILKEHPVYYIKVWNADDPAIVGIGEAAPLKGLSVDDSPDFEKKIQQISKQLAGIELEKNQAWLLNLVDEFVPDTFPALKFALETALLDWLNGGKRIVYNNSFSRGEKKLKINGLIWMGDEDFMRQQIEDKIQQGFSCIKMKIGALDFDKELQLIAEIRKNFSPQQITLRVDANGAFQPNEVMQKLEKLASYHIHSIEQPIKAGQEEILAKICQISPIPIALDEELIGKFEAYDKKNLLETIRPAFIVLKPTLLGGLCATTQWIEIAQEMRIDWWMTSALESNIGLNAICQYSAEWDNSLPQGLGTGGLYQNNIPSPLYLQGDEIGYNPQAHWELNNL